jgi:hypothetical protein
MRYATAFLIGVLGQSGGDATLRLDGTKKTPPLKFVVDHLDLATPGGTTEKKEFRITLEATLALEQDAKGPRVALTLRRIARVNDGARIDSSSSEASPPVTLFKLLCGTPIGLRPGVSKGDDMEGLSDLLAKAARGAGAPDAAVPRLKDWLSGILLQDVVPFVFFHPARPQKVGGSWSIPLGGTSQDYPLVGDAGWTVGARKEGRMFLKLKSSVKTAPPAKPDGDKIPIVRELAGTLEGTLDADEASGWIVRAEAERKLSGKSTLTGLASPRPGDVWAIESRSTYTIAPEK